MAEKRNPDLVQASDHFYTVYFMQAHEAQEKLCSLVADEWIQDLEKPPLRHPAHGKAREWVESADDPRASKARSARSRRWPTTTAAMPTSSRTWRA